MGDGFKYLIEEFSKALTQLFWIVILIIAVVAILFFIIGRASAQEINTRYKAGDRFTLRWEGDIPKALWPEYNIDIMVEQGFFIPGHLTGSETTVRNVELNLDKNYAVFEMLVPMTKADITSNIDEFAFALELPKRTIPMFIVIHRIETQTTGADVIKFFSNNDKYWEYIRENFLATRNKKNLIFLGTIYFDKEINYQNVESEFRIHVLDHEKKVE